MSCVGFFHPIKLFSLIVKQYTTLTPSLEDDYKKTVCASM